MKTRNIASNKSRNVFEQYKKYTQTFYYTKINICMHMQINYPIYYIHVDCLGLRVHKYLNVLCDVKL